MRARLAPPPPPAADEGECAADASGVASPEREGQAAHAALALARLTIARAPSSSDVALSGFSRRPSHDLPCVRDSVSDAARRERRRRGATGSPSLSVCALVRHVSSASVASDASGTSPPQGMLPTRTASCPFGLGQLQAGLRGGRLGAAHAVAAAPPRCLRSRSVIEHL